MFGEKIDIVDGLLVSVVAMSIVFLILLIIMGCLKLFVYIGKLQAEHKPTQVPTKTLNKLDFSDEDMVVACLVATIDANKEYGNNMRVVSVKQI